MRKLNAREFCAIMFYMGKCGLRRAGAYGLRPGSRSGHYNRKLKKKLGIYGNSGTYRMKVIGRSRKPGRQEIDLDLKPAHELVANDIRTDAICMADLQGMVDRRELLECYYENEVVKRST